MYRLKNIVPLDCEVTLPTCMYNLKNINEPIIAEEMDVNISNQQAPATKMTELEERQDLLLKKLDILYDRIKTISSYCKLNNAENATTLETNDKTSSDKSDKYTLEKSDKNTFEKSDKNTMEKSDNNTLKKSDKNTMEKSDKNTMEKSDNNTLKKSDKIMLNVHMEEIVIVLSPDNIPWFLNIYLKKVKGVNISWHIHSSVPNEKKTRIQMFFKKFSALYPVVSTRINLRLIFKSVAADCELKISSLEIPIIGIVNVMRYLALMYPNIVPYDYNDYQADALLDLCCLLERSSEKNKEAITKKLFSQQKNWIHGNRFSIVDIAVYNIIKQWQNSAKYVPKTWFENCEKLIS